MNQKEIRLMNTAYTAFLLCFSLITLNGAQQELIALHLMLSALSSSAAPAPSPLASSSIETALNEFLITSARNDFVPKGVTGLVRLTPQFSVGQLLVAWQDMPFSIFVQDQTVQGVNNLVKIDLGFFSNPQLQWFLDHLIPPEHERDNLKTILPSSHLLVGGGAASCGYHACKNGLLLSQLALAPQSTYQNILTHATDERLALSLFGFQDEATRLILGQNYIRPWRKAVIDLISHTRNIASNMGEWLTEEGLQHLWNALPQITHPDLLPLDTTHLPLLCIIPHGVLQGDYSFLTDEQKKEYTTAIAYARKGGSVVFIANVDIGYIQGQPRGHWISLISFVKNEDQYVLIADSKNSIRYTQREIHTILKDLSGLQETFDETVATVIGDVPDKEKIMQERGTATGGISEEEKRMQAQLEASFRNKNKGAITP